MLDGRSVPLDGKSNLLLRYRGEKRTFPYVSAADVLSGLAGAGTFKDKLVFVGTTALGTREVVATPLDTLFAGVEVQATVADNLLQQDFIHRPEHGVALETQSCSGSASSWRCWSVGSASPGARSPSATCLAAAWAGAVSLMSTGGIFLSPLFPTLGLTSALAAMTVGVVHARAPPRRSRGPGEDDIAAPDGADAAVAHRSQGCRDRPAFAAHPAVHACPRRAARDASELPRTI